MSANRMIELLKEWGIPFQEHKFGQISWRDHNRNQKGAWGVEMHGSMIHHTGSNNQDSMIQTLWNGYAGLPGPLCHGGIDTHGVVHLVGWGRANHAGLGSHTVLNHVINEDYGAVTLKPGPADTDGNAHFYGWEVMYDGQVGMTDAQYKSTIRLQAAICTEHGWKDKSVIAHGEWQQGKWDPGYRGKLMPMQEARGHIWQAIQEGPKPKLPTRPKPAPSGTGTVTVGNSDTLWGLAEKYLGSGDRWIEFVEANPSLVVLKPGVKLTIPKK